MECNLVLYHCGKSCSDKVVLSGDCKSLVLEFDSLVALTPISCLTQGIRLGFIKGFSSVVRITAFKAVYGGSIPPTPVIKYIGDLV